MSLYVESEESVKLYFESAQALVIDCIKPIHMNLI